MNRQTALGFVDAINGHDVERIVSLMTDDHIFIDAYGNTESRDAMKKGWPGYFSWFPDYRIEVSDVLVSGNVVALFGHASGTYHGIETPDNMNHWRIPAAWRVVVEHGKVKVWQVYADSKIPFDIMNAADQADTGRKKF